MVTPEMNFVLTKGISNEEIERAIFSMNGLGSPGPDGFPAIFYQNHWGVIGPDICATVKNAFLAAEWPKDFNATYITLIPKVKNPSRVTDFRPISLCNVIYKILAKVLANRLKLFLSQLISNTQNAFVPNSLITDNVVVAFEAMHSMQTQIKGNEGFMALKLDMSKAYDRIEWSFLQAVMIRMGFDSKWIEVILRCVSTVSYFVLLNGIPKSSFTPSRGIRQGDHLSPYLFIICVESLSKMIQSAEGTGAITGVPLGRNQASGQRLNKEKTSILFSKNTKAEARDLITQVAGIQSSQPYDKYLGLPVEIDSKSLLLEIGRLTQQFCWGQKVEERKMQWCHWDKMVKAKAVGGLGFRDLEHFNHAMLAKQGWRLLHFPNSLAAKVLSPKYYPDGQFLKATTPRHSSLIWRSLRAAKPLLEEGLFWHIGNGAGTKIWHHKWLPIPTSFKVQSPISCFDPEESISALIDHEAKTWKTNVIDQVFLQREAEIIRQIPISLCNSPDKVVWRCTSNGIFSVRSAYHLQLELHQRDKESVEHVLWECVAARDVWCLCSSKLQKQCKNQINFRSLLMHMVQELEHEVLMEVAVVAWKIWRGMNDLVFNQTFSTPQFIVRKATQKLEDLIALFSQQTSNSTTTIPQTIQWSAPPADVYKVNWDSAVAKVNCKVGVGTIIQNWEGRVIACMRMCRPLFPDPYLAETFGALQSVKLALDIGLKQIKLEENAMNVINDIKGNKDSWKQTGLIITDIKQMLLSFDSFSVDFAPRGCNSLAHCLARDALHITDVLVDIEDVPYCIASLL
ncbi:uncharacterized protein LOC122310366 [Carya illinoinensis]|uniref:uncharacterized protein LOC122310366 n=1 Tax=Carya illinoinensis TaxID=32201 RepID=UPI001C7231F6|nr:uncharacterized protein LOC122310366 [Carya illinoinensis]